MGVTRTPLFKGRFIDDDGCCWAQGDVLRCSGRSDAEIRAMNQVVADRETARLLGISVAHAVLLRNVNDRADGAPQSVLRASGLAKILGPNWRLVLALWRHFDAMTKDDWSKVTSEAGKTAWDVTWDAAWDVARYAAPTAERNAAWDATWNAVWAVTWEPEWALARDVMGAAVGEIVAINVLKSPPYFLRFFFADVPAWIEANKDYRPTGIVED